MHHVALQLGISCDWQPPYLVQISDSSLPPFPTLERLCIYEVPHSRPQWEDHMETTQWLVPLHLFPSVKDLGLSGNIFSRWSSEPAYKAIWQFITVRELSGRPVAVHHQERESWQHIHREAGD